MDETRIDAAPTPAHVFAYRAIRGVFYGSPESSPVKPHDANAEQTLDAEDKFVSSTRARRFATSPIHTKRKDTENDPVDIVLSLTPKKQKIVPVSPSKSILKNTNGLTPKRAALRDVTVTFKDVSLSLSPQLARKPSPRKVRSITATSKIEAHAYSARPSTGAQATTGPLKKRIDSCKAGGADLEAYKVQTEKETRRLIKYGQKWKEQARRAEAENAKLRALLEQAQRQNAALEKRILNSERLCASLSQPRMSHDETKQHKLSSKMRKASLEQKTNELLQLEPAPFIDPRTSESTQTLEARTEAAYSRAIPEEEEVNQMSRASLRFDPTKSLSAGATTREDSMPRKAARIISAYEPGRDQPEKHFELRLQSVNRSISQPVTLTSDRLAAARARIEARNRERASSNAVLHTSANDSPDLPVTSKESSKLPISDDSAIDWAGA